MQLPVNPEKAVALLLAELPKRSATVVEKRFGLSKGGKRYTLDAIGKGYSITRERVRQIERDSIIRVQKTSAYANLSSLIETFERFVKEKGGCVAESLLLQNAAPNGDSEKNAVRFLLTVFPPFSYRDGNEHFYSYWYNSMGVRDEVEKALLNTARRVWQAHTVFTKEGILAMIREEAPSLFPEGVDASRAEGYLFLSRNLASNAFGQWGSAASPLIRPRGVRDMAYLVLREKNCPLHFTAVATLVGELVAKRPVHVQTVHNELIKDDRFVLIGRGTYGLSQWGYTPGTVRDVISDALKDGPLGREEIARRVSEKRQVKENTIFINLQNKTFFRRLEDGRYTCQ